MNNLKVLKEALIYSPILVASLFFSSCTDVNLFKSGGLVQSSLKTGAGIDTGNDKTKEQEEEKKEEDKTGPDYVYNGSCSLKFNLGRTSSLTPELKKGDQTCIEYSPKAYQGADSTGATIIIVSAVWCGPCQQLKSKFSELSDVAEKHKATVKIFLDSGQLTQSAMDGYGPSEFFVSSDIQALESKYGRLASFPTIFIIDKNGKRVKDIPNYGPDYVISESDKFLETL